MSDSTVAEGLRDNANYLWILFLSLFFLLFSLSLFLLCQKAVCFCHRYCIFNGCRCGCCCRINVEEYQREREHRLRVRHHLRQHHAAQAAAAAAAAGGMAHHHVHHPHSEIALATFTQIPGPIPDAHGFRELHRQAAVRDLATTTTSSMRFIVVTQPAAASGSNAPSASSASATRPAGTNHSTHPANINDANSMQMRNLLTAQQRKDILDRILTCTIYHTVEEELKSIHKLTDDIGNEGDVDVEQGGGQLRVQEQLQQKQPLAQEAETTMTSSTPIVSNYAFPLHEEPAEPEKTCAICLDDFVEGESINDTSKCPHVFHKACLIEWLDMHDACPCCRCAMITDTEWRHAATQYRGESSTSNHGSTSTRTENTNHQATSGHHLRVVEQPQTQQSGTLAGREPSESSIDQEQVTTAEVTVSESNESRPPSSTLAVDRHVQGTEAETTDDPTESGGS